MRIRGRLRNLTVGVCAGTLTVVSPGVSALAGALVAPDHVLTLHPDSEPTSEPGETPEVVADPRTSPAPAETESAAADAAAIDAAYRYDFGGLSPTDTLNTTLVASLERRPMATQDPDGPRLNTTGRTMTIVAPLKDSELFLGEVEVQIAPDDSIQVAVQQVAELLGRSVDPASLEPLRGLMEPGVFAPLCIYEASYTP